MSDFIITLIIIYCGVACVGMLFAIISIIEPDAKKVNISKLLFIIGASILWPITISFVVLFLLIIFIISIPMFFYKSVLVFIKGYKSFGGFIGRIKSELKKEIEDLI